MRITRITRAAGAAVLLLSAATALDAQSLTAIRGLGHPVSATDARAEALGGLGIGLKGLAVPLVNVASAAEVRRPGALVTVAALEQTESLGGVSEGIGATRFPLIQVFYPLERMVLTAGFGTYLDQSWGVIRQGEQVSAGATIPYEDQIVSTGGIGQVQVGVAVPLGERFAVGAAVGAHTGNRRLEFGRRFDSTSVGDLAPFSQVTTVQYSAPLVQLGARWDPIQILRLAASVAWGGTLSADSSSGPARDEEYDLPLRVSGGISSYLGPNLLATVSGRWSGWSSVGSIAGPEPGSTALSTSRDTWEVGGGLEWDNPASRAPRSFPIRLGAQYRQLPFSFTGEAPTEWFVGGGVGMRVGGIDNPLARVDLTVQRGERTAAGNGSIGELTEEAWRFVVSLAVFGT